MPILKSWKCYKCLDIIIDSLESGELFYTNKIEEILDNGFKLMEVQSDSIPYFDNGWICDCGKWIYDKDFYHEPVEYLSKYMITWCPVCEVQSYMNFVEGISYFCEKCESIVCSEYEPF